MLLTTSKAWDADCWVPFYTAPYDPLQFPDEGLREWSLDEFDRLNEEEELEEVVPPTTPVKL